MRILILGGAGMLGHQLWKRLPARFSDTWVTIRGKKDQYASSRLFEHPRVRECVDVTDFTRLEALLSELRPNVVINCVALTKRKIKPGSYSEAVLLNALLPHRLSEIAARIQCRVIHFSTDCVFSGSKGDYTESSTFDSVDVYGLSKALGELSDGHCLTLRSSFVGPEIAVGTELLSWFLSQDGKKVKGFKNAVFSGLTTPVAADLIGELIEKFPKLSGVYQVASEPISKYNLLGLFREAFGVRVEIEPEESFVCRRNLNGKLFKEAVGWSAPPWPDMVRAMASS